MTDKPTFEEWVKGLGIDLTSRQLQVGILAHIRRTRGLQNPMWVMAQILGLKDLPTGPAYLQHEEEFDENESDNSSKDPERP